MSCYGLKDRAWYLAMFESLTSNHSEENVFCPDLSKPEANRLHVPISIMKVS